MGALGPEARAEKRARGAHGPVPADTGKFVTARIEEIRASADALRQQRERKETTRVARMEQRRKEVAGRSAKRLRTRWLSKPGARPTAGGQTPGRVHVPVSLTGGQTPGEISTCIYFRPSLSSWWAASVT